MRKLNVLLTAVIFLGFASKATAQTDTLTLRRADGSTYELEGEVEHYKDNKFVILLGAGGKTIFSLEQVQKIEFSQASSKTVIPEDTLTLRKDDDSTFVFKGRIKGYDDNKFAVVSSSGEEKIFPMEQVQAIKFQERFPKPKKKKLGADSLKVVISLEKHKIHEDEFGYENCSGYHIWVSKIPLNIESIESNAKTKARKRDTGTKFKKSIEKQFYEWYFYEDLVEEFKKLPYHSTTDVKGVGVIRDLPPGIYCVGVYGRSSGRTYGVRHNVDFAWYHQVEVRDSEAARLNLNFSNRKVTAIDRNWNLYGGK